MVAQRQKETNRAQGGRELGVRRPGTPFEAMRSVEKAIAAARLLGEEVLTVTVARKLGEHDQLAHVEVQANKFAEWLLQSVRAWDTRDVHKDLVPNAGLVEAIEEGRTLKGRSTSAEALFDALEKEGQN